MRAAARLLAVLILAAPVSAIAQEKHLIDPTPPGSLNPEPLPSLQNPDAPSTPAKELFARKSTSSVARALKTRNPSVCDRNPIVDFPAWIVRFCASKFYFYSIEDPSGEEPKTYLEDLKKSRTSVGH